MWYKGGMLFNLLKAEGTRYEINLVQKVETIDFQSNCQHVFHEMIWMEIRWGSPFTGSKVKPIQFRVVLLQWTFVGLLRKSSWSSYKKHNFRNQIERRKITRKIASRKNRHFLLFYYFVIWSKFFLLRI